MGNQDKRSVCVQFSGGSDSSLTAYRMAQEFDRVHLLTFKHFGQKNIENSRMSFGVLNEKFPGKFQHQIINVSELFSTIYNRNYFKNLIRYKTLQLQFICFACQASFHIKTIAYCKKNDILDVRDGSNTEYEEASPMQIKIVKEEIRKLYASYGILHDSPVYNEHESSRSDYQLFQLGLRNRPDIKDDDELYKKYQGYCKYMPGGVIFLNYWKLCKGFPEQIQIKMKEHWLEEVSFLKHMIQKELI